MINIERLLFILNSEGDDHTAVLQVRLLNCGNIVAQIVDTDETEQALLDLQGDQFLQRQGLSIEGATRSLDALACLTVDKYEAEKEND